MSNNGCDFFSLFFFFFNVFELSSSIRTPIDWSGRALV
jgi:hypothetical protein